MQPIIGMTALVEGATGGPAATCPAQIVLLATGAEGYRSLCRLSSALVGSPGARTGRRWLTWEEIANQGWHHLSVGRTPRLADQLLQAVTQHSRSIGQPACRRLW